MFKQKKLKMFFVGFIFFHSLTLLVPRLHSSTVWVNRLLLQPFIHKVLSESLRLYRCVFCQTLFKKFKMLMPQREEKERSSDGDDPLSVIIANKETGELRAGENTQA